MRHADYHLIASSPARFSPVPLTDQQEIIYKTKRGEENN